MGDEVKPPFALWSLSLVLSLLGFVAGVFLGGSLVGYSMGLVGTVLAFLSLYVNRRRQMNRNYEHNFPWFQRSASAVYVSGVVVTLLHIVRFAIELGNA